MKSAFKERQLSDYSTTSQRPKRNASTKGLGCSNGLHWMEEKQLKKALYASLNETKKARLLDENTSEDSREQTPKTSTTTVVTKKAADIDSKRIKVHAQRKFAQGSNPNSPMPTPVKLLPPCRDSKETVSQPSTLLPCKRRPKTEDFLTFLCLRGSSALPPALDFMSGTAFSGSSSSSDRSSSPDLDAPVTSTNAESKDKGGSGNAHGGTASAELRSQAQRTSARVLKQERRPLRLDNGEEKQRIEHRASRSAIVKKVDKKKAASEKLKNVYKTGSTSRSLRKSSGNLTALQEKYKQQRIKHQSASCRKPSALGLGGGHALRSQASHEASHLTSKGAVKNSCVKLREQPTSAPSSRHPILSKDEDMAAKSRLVLKKQLSVQLTRLHPRVAAGLRYPFVTNMTAGVMTRRHSVGITPHLRKAKMVPPIVDYESESEKDMSPLSPPRSSVIAVQPRPRAAGSKTLNAPQKPKAKVDTSAPITKKKPTTSLIARRLLSRATTSMRPSLKVRKATRCAMFRRKTRSLGPVKEYPLVLALPTKRGAGRSGTTAMKKKMDELAANASKSKASLTKGCELLPASSRASATAVHRETKKGMLLRPSDSVAKRSSRRPSSESVKDTRRLRQRNDISSAQYPRQNRKASVGISEEAQKATVAKRRRTEGSTSIALSNRVFSDSDDEPLIKMARRHTEKKAGLRDKVKENDSDPLQIKSDSAKKCGVSSLPPSGMLSRRKPAPAKNKSKPSEADKSKLLKTSLSSERFSEPSPSSLSETIADAAGDPLDTQAHFDDLESMSGGVEALDALAGEISQVMSCRLSFGSAQEIQSLMTSEFSGAFDENVTGAMLLSTQDGRSASFEGGLNLLKRDDTPSKIDASTNTSEEGMALCAPSTPEELVVMPEEVSVSTQTGIFDADVLNKEGFLTVAPTARRLSFIASETNGAAALEFSSEMQKLLPASPKSKPTSSPSQHLALVQDCSTKLDTRADRTSVDPTSEIGSRASSMQLHTSLSTHTSSSKFGVAKAVTETKGRHVSGAAKVAVVVTPMQRHGSLNPTLGSRASVARTSITKASAAKASVMKASAARTSSENASVVKASAGRPRVAKSSVAAVRTVRASVPRTSVAKTSVMSADAMSDARASDTKASNLSTSSVKGSGTSVDPRVSNARASKSCSPKMAFTFTKAGTSKRGKVGSEDTRRVKLTPLDSKKFPSVSDPACLVAAPTYRPTTEEMRDPISYITKIRPEAEKFGICKIVLPPSFQPECKVFDDMRFTAYNQYIHKMLSRWGPNVQHMACIKRCFTNQGITDDQPPLIGGIELDLSHLYHTVQNFGGIQQVMEKKKWHRVADAMHIPKAAQDRVSKVDDAYCKFVLPYDLLSADEKKAIERQVLADRERQMAAESEPSSTSADEDEEDEFSNECVAKVSRYFASCASHGRMRQPPAWTDQSNTRKGRNISLSVFSRVARNTMSMWYKHEPSTEEVEKDYWNLVIDQRRHVCVHAGNIDSSVHGSGFPTNRLVPFAKHPWNLKVLTNNPGTVLRCMGPVSGVTIPTLHLSMLYTTGCWYRDPHCLPWIEYLHTGANKIWYSVPAHSSNRFRAAMKEIMPQVCKDSVIWLPSDCAMVPPPQLVEHGCPLSRLVQEKGQFVVIFPGAFTSTIACGYSVSESVYFATQDWLLQAAECFEHMKASCEPPTFSFEKLILGIATEHRENLDTCRWTLPLLRKMCENEQRYRTQLVEMGLKTFERLRLDEAAEPKKAKRPRLRPEDSNHECDFCRISCHVSMVVNMQDDILYCLEHAVHCLQRKNMKSWKLLYTYDMDELRSILRKLEQHLESQESSQTKVDSDSSPLKKKIAKKK
ncbi:jumonji, AT rich interactive domain 2 [Rhipicephalus microplus]